MTHTEDEIRAKIQRIFEKNPNIRMNVNLRKPKLVLVNASAVIKGVYPHIFQIEETSNGRLRTHTLKYTDIISGQIEVL